MSTLPSCDRGATLRAKRMVRRQTGPVILQPRDLAILEIAYRQRMITREAVMRLGLFGSVPRAVSRLRQLFDGGLLDRHAAVWVSAPLIYRIGKLAVPVLAEHLGLDAAALTKAVNSDLSQLMLQHSLMQLTTRVAFYEAAVRHGVAIRWLAEGECLHAYRLRRAGVDVEQSHILRPDGYVGIQDGSQVQHYFIECDRASEALRILRDKAVQYSIYQDTAFPRTYDAGRFAVLFITTTDRRADNVRGTLGSGSVAWLFTTADRLCSDALGDIWLPVSGNRRLSILDHDGGAI